MNTPKKPSLFKTSLLVALMGAAFASHAAGLGKLTVNSAIGQPLDAVVTLTATPEELNGMSAKLAPHSAFAEAGIEFMSALNGLRFELAKQADGQPVLRLSTLAPLNEPFLHFLVELNWTAGRVVREYTFLLDPPEMLQMNQPAVPAAAAAVAAPASVASAPAAPAPVAPATQAAAPVAPPAQAISPPRPAAQQPSATKPAPAVPSAASVPEAHEVKAGDTLSKIARTYYQDSAGGVSLDQMLVALFNNNREAFDEGNMNRLRAGKILRLPEPDTLAEVDGAQARKLVLTQAADFNAYRRRLADMAAGAPVADAPARQQASGKIEAPKPAAPPPVAADKLEVSPTESARDGAAGKDAKLSGDLRRLEEDLVARDKSLREAAERIAQLEKNLENLKRLVELKSQAGADLQQQAQAQAKSPTPAAAPEPTPPAAAKLEKPAEPAVSPEKPADTAAPAAPAAPAPAVAEPAAVAEKPADTAPAKEEPTPQPAPGESASETAAKPEPKQEAKPEPKPAATKPLPPAPPPPPPPSFIEENPELVMGGGGIIAVLLGYLGYGVWRRRKQAQQDAQLAADEDALPAAAVGSAGTASIDSGEVSIQGDFSEGGVLTTEERVDPVAEADVLMAYGRDAQAEEVLKEGLRTDPTRAAIHLKLLELYANRQSVEPFESVAEDLHQLTQGNGPEWERASKLARDLGVTSALFAVGVSSLSPASQARENADDVEAMPFPDQALPPTLTADETAVDLLADAVVPETAKIASEVETDAVPAESPETYSNSLDFDLDLGSTSIPAAAAEATATEEKAAAEEVMSLDFDFDLGTTEDKPGATDTPALASAEVAGAAEADSNGIDFSLDLGTDTFGEPAVAGAAETSATADAEPAPATATTNAAAGTDGFDFDFDLDLGSTETPPETAEIAVDAAQAIPAEEGAAVLDIPADLSLDLDLPADLSVDLPTEEVVSALPELDAVPAPGEVAESTDLLLPDIGNDDGAAASPALNTAGTDFDLALDDMSADAMLPEMPSLPQAEIDEPRQSSVKEPVKDDAAFSGLKIDLPDIDLPDIDLPDIDLPAVNAPVESAVAESALDLPDSLDAAVSDFDLQLDANEGLGTGGDSALADTGDVDDPEVATKLELAQAYEEMGDREGASELLHEVLGEGSAAQRALAQARLDKLNA